MPTPQLSQRLAGERGSLPFAMLLAVIAGGLMILVVTKTMTVQAATRFDRDFVEVVQGSDAGVNQALFQLNAGHINDLTIDPVTRTTPTYRHTLDGTTYRWNARQVDPMTWEVISTAHLQGTTRTAVATIKEIPKVQMVAFANTIVELPGNNTIDSYNSNTTCLVGGGCAWGPLGTGTGNGTIGSNGTVRIGGSSSVVDRVELWDWANNPSYARCTLQNATCPTSLVWPKDPRLDYRSDAEMKFIRDGITACQAEGRMGGEWRASANAGSISPATLLPPGFTPPAGMTANDYTFFCWDSLNFDANTVLADPTREHVIYVRNSVQVAGAAKINCPSPCSKPNVAPKAPALQVYLLGGDVNVRQQAGFGGIIYAPRANCGSPQSNASVEFFGAIVCEEFKNQGAWSLHFDDAITAEGSGTFRVAAWREEPMARLP